MSLLILLVAFIAIVQLPGNAQNLDDSFGSDTSGSFDVLSYDIFNNDTPSSPGLSSEEIRKRIDSYTRSLPGDPKSLYGVLDGLLRKRLENWRYPNLSKLSVWSGYCQGVLDKAVSINNRTEYQNSFHNRTRREISRTLQEKREIDDCWNAWLKAYNAVLTLLPHNKAEEEEPRSSQNRAAAQKAIELAESICHYRPLTALPPPPQDGGDKPPPLAPQRPVPALPGPQQPIVIRGRIVSNAHFERVKSIIDRLPLNIQQFMRNHRIKVVATDTVVGQHPELRGVRPPDYPAGWTWENSDGTYFRPTSEVIIADRILIGREWQRGPRVDSVARHETGHAIDHHMGDFSHRNEAFIDVYNRERASVSGSVRDSLRYVLRPCGRGQEETFAELFAVLYGGSAGSEQNQRLLETYFPKTLSLMRSTMNSLR